MRAVRWLTLCVLSVVGVCGLVAPYSGSAAGDVVGAGTPGAGVGGLLAGPLVVPGSPMEGQQLRAAAEARRVNPAASAARYASASRFAHLSAAQAAALAREAFPGVLDDPAGGGPTLPAGESIVAYPTDRAARVDLGDGKHGVIESLAPIAVETSPGRRSPVDLSLADVAGGFEPSRPVIGVHIPKHVSEGVRLAGTGVSLTPVDESGSALGGAEGVVDGAGVLYANTQTDADTLVKPTTAGFAADTMLRSAESPQQLSYRVGMPAGARLVAEGNGAGQATVLDKGKVLATVSEPSAQDAAGTTVPVSMSASGDLLRLTVKHRAGEYQYPIAVDPDVVAADGQLGVLEGYYQSHWKVETSDHKEGPFYFAEGSGSIEDYTKESSSLKRLEFAAIAYEAPGDSSIEVAENLKASGSGAAHNADIESQLKITGKNGKVEAGVDAYPEHFSFENLRLCTTELCKATEPTSEMEGNRLSFEQIAKEVSDPYVEQTYLESATVKLDQTGKSTAAFDTTDPEVSGHPNALYGTERWVSPSSGYVKGIATDPGIGVSEVKLTSTSAPKWGLAESFLYPSHSGACQGVICLKEETTPESLASLPEGKDTVTFSARNEAEDEAEAATASATVYVDSTIPHGISLTGLGSGEIGEGAYTLKAEASAADAGLKSLALIVDGREVGKAGGACSPGPCTGKAEWTVNGDEFGAGTHQLTVAATDRAGNVGSETYTLKVHHAEPLAIGPGAVDPQSGELSMSASDVAISAPGAGLSLTRSYGSRHLTAGAEGPLGPQWRLALGGQESIVKLEDGNATLTASSGAQTTFTSSGGEKLTSPSGDSNLTLSEVKNGKGEVSEYVLKDATAGDTTRFTAATSNTQLWKPTEQEGPLAARSVRYTYRTVEGVTEPTEALAPELPGVSCGKEAKEREVKELKPGCRALTFEYATQKTATGEKPSEWGAYKGRLKEVLYSAYNPATKEIKPIVVAEYKYDAKGRLRYVANPQISPTLATTYGYDAEGHVTAVSPAGQEPWLLHYGTSPNDANPGRLLSVIRPAATTPSELKATEEQAPPVNTTAPTLSSTTPKVGTKISVSGNGTWSNSPLSYGYQWEDCNQSGGECAPIPGAVNQSYYPVTSDVSHDLVAQVTASNANGAVTAVSAATGLVQSGTPSSPAPEPPSVGSSSVWTVEYQVPLSGSSELPTMTKTEEERWGEGDEPVEATAIFPPDTPMGWPAKAYKRATVEYLDKSGRTVNAYSPSGGISTSEYNSYNDVTRTLSPDDRAAALKETCESKEHCKSAELAKLLSSESTYEEKGSEPGTELLSSLGPQHTVELTNGTQVQAREHTVYSYDEGEPTEGGPYDLVTKTTEGAVVAGVEEPESVRTTVTGYSGTGSQENLGWTLRKPTSVTTDPAGLNLEHVIEYEPGTGEVSETKLPAASGRDAKVAPVYGSQFGSKGSGADELKEPDGIAVGPSGEVLVADRNNQRIDKFNAKGEFVEAFGFGVANGKEEPEVCTSSCEVGLSGSKEGQFSKPEGIAFSGSDFYVSEKGNDRVQEFNEKDEAIASFGTKGSAEGELKEPDGVAVDAKGDVWVVDYANNRVEEFSSKGVFKEAIGWDVTIFEGNEFSICTVDCRAGTAGDGHGQFSKPQGITYFEGELYVTDSRNNRVERFAESGGYLGEFGATGTGNGQFEGPTGIAGDGVNGDLYVVDEGNGRVEAFSPAGEYRSQFATKGAGNGELKAPEGVAVNAAGEAYVDDAGNDRIEEWVPTVTGNEGAHDTRTIYYTTAPNEEYGTCGKHPEWAGLVCESRPVAQPGASGLPQLPVTTVTGYNVWDEPTTTEEEVPGGPKRTKTETYDAAGRLKTSSTTSTVGTALPTVTYGYAGEGGAETGAVTSLKREGEADTSIYDTLGQLVSYTDSNGVTSSYEYDEDGRLRKANDGKGTQTYKYGATSGLLEELVDSSHEGMKFSATYDVEGKMLTEGYPNGMVASYAYNQVGAPTSLQYVKTTHCTEEKEKCKWFVDSVVPSIHGQWLTQTSSFSKQAYTYDAAGRLTQVQNTPTGKGCTTRVYAYDEDTNRTSLTTRESPTEKCATEGGTVESHTYDTADRLTDSGVDYNEFGDITSLSPADAEGQRLTSAYYVDNQIASQSQGNQTIDYMLDPAGRTRETVSTGLKTSVILSNYAGPGSSLSWSENKPSGETARNIPGINGQLAAVQYNGEAPTLQLANLHGDIIATASLSETATELASKADTSEFGVPTNSLPPKYSWLGAIELPTELPSGVISMGARSYVPQLGRFLQPDPVPGGSANAYSYTFGDPVNSSDPSGEYTWGVSASLFASLEQASEEVAAREVAREEAERRAAEEAAARLAAERAAEEAAWAAESAAGPQYWEEWEEWEEEGGYEEIAYRQGSSGGEAPHIESALLVQPLGDKRGQGEADSTLGFSVPLCEAGSEGSCGHLEATGHRRRGMVSRFNACHSPSLCGSPRQKREEACRAQHKREGRRWGCVEDDFSTEGNYSTTTIEG
jgi:RHS repeat-associated protein